MALNRTSAYTQQLDELVRNASDLSPEARLRVLNLLRDADNEITSMLAKTDPSTYTASRLVSLKAEVARVMDSFAQQATAQLQQLETKAYRVGMNGVASTISAALGNVAVHPVINQRELGIIQGYTADLVTGVSVETRSKITSAIQRAHLVGFSPTQLVQQIGEPLEDGSFSGIFSQTGARAMSIGSNEVMRVHSVSSQATISDLATRHEGLEKGWLHIPAALVPRISHILASGQTRKPDEPFEVGGEALMYPRDPAGSAHNTINCHCILQPRVPAHLLASTSADRQRLANLGISINQAA